MEIELTAVFRRVPEGYIAFVEELPGTNTQGATLAEARENLREAIVLVVEANPLARCHPIVEGPSLRPRTDPSLAPLARAPLRLPDVR